MGEDATRVDLFKLCHALGVGSVRELDAYDYDAAVVMIKEEMARPGPSVIITTRPCVLMPKRIMDEPYVVDMELCNGCSACFRISCPAIAASHETNKHGHPKAVIDDTTCTGCTLCAQICPTAQIF
jgi:indolepyruvate ferredoxin oxidoreductase alpha subunit